MHAAAVFNSLRSVCTGPALEENESYPLSPLSYAGVADEGIMLIRAPCTVKVGRLSVLTKQQSLFLCFVYVPLSQSDTKLLAATLNKWL